MNDTVNDTQNAQIEAVGPIDKRAAREASCPIPHPKVSGQQAPAGRRRSQFDVDRADAVGHGCAQSGWHIDALTSSFSGLWWVLSPPNFKNGEPPGESERNSGPVTPGRAHRNLLPRTHHVWNCHTRGQPSPLCQGNSASARHQSSHARTGNCTEAFSATRQDWLEVASSSFGGGRLHRPTQSGPRRQAMSPVAQEEEPATTKSLPS